MEDCKTVNTPLAMATKLTEDTEEADDHEELPYRELVGGLTYLAVGTRLDIACAISWLGQHNKKFKKCHWIAAKRVFPYLKWTVNYALQYKFIKDL